MTLLFRASGFAEGLHTGTCLANLLLLVACRRGMNEGLLGDTRVKLRGPLHCVTKQGTTN